MSANDGLREFESDEDVIAFLKQRADDIDFVRIPVPTDVQVGKRHVSHLGAIIHLSDGTKRMIGREAAELLLNDGLLNRLRVHIKLLNPVPRDQ